MKTLSRHIVTAVLLLSLLSGGCNPEVKATPTPEVTSTPAATQPPTAVPTPTGPQAKVQEVINKVEAHPLAEEQWEPATITTTIYLDGAVRAYEASTARLKVDEDLVRVAPNTIFKLSQPDEHVTQLDLKEGRVWVNIEGLDKNDTFQVETPVAVAAVSGTRFSVQVATDGTTLVSTRVNTVTVTAQGTAVDVGPGRQTTVAPGQPPTPPVSMTPAERILWGMAGNANLDVALPAISATQVISYDASLYTPSFSPDMKYMTAKFSSKDESGKYSSGPILFDLGTGQSLPLGLPDTTTVPVFNPAGTALAYSTGTKLCVAEPTGANPKCWGSGAYQEPLWSPDGNWLLFNFAKNSTSPWNLFKARTDGSETTQLTTFTTKYTPYAAWSPDGTQIAYTQPATGTVPYEKPGGLWVMKADGSSQRQLLDVAKWYIYPVWTPDGKTVVISGYGGTQDTPGSGGIWAAPVDGTPPWTIVPADVGWTCYDPIFSPTPSGWPVFFSGYNAISKAGGIMYVTGKDAEPQTLGAFSWGPVWGSGGAWAAFASKTPTIATDTLSSQIYIARLEKGFWP